MTKPTKWVCAQRRLRSAWAESSLCALWVAKDPRFLHADSEDSDQTGRMFRLIWVFARRRLILLVLSCRGSYFIKGLTEFSCELWNLLLPLYLFCVMKSRTMSTRVLRYYIVYSVDLLIGYVLETENAHLETKPFIVILAYSRIYWGHPYIAA